MCMTSMKRKKFFKSGIRRALPLTYSRISHVCGKNKPTIPIKSSPDLNNKRYMLFL